MAIRSLRGVLSLAIVLGLIAAGCGNKEAEQTQAETEQAPQLSEASEPEEDIFDEFYDEETESDLEPEAAVEPTETFYTDTYSPQFAPDGRYVVQVSCVASQGFGNNLVQKLIDKGYPAYLAQVDNPTPELLGTYYRVRIGGFNGVSVAEEFGEKALLTDGYEYWVDNKSNDNVGMSGYGMGEAGSGTGGYESSYSSGYESSTYESSYESSPTTESSGSSYESTTAAEPAASTESSYGSETESASSDDSWGSTGTETSSSSDSWGSTGTETSTSEDAMGTTTESSTPAAEMPANETTTPEPSSGESTEDSWGDDWGDDW